MNKLPHLTHFVIIALLGLIGYLVVAHEQRNATRTQSSFTQNYEESAQKVSVLFIGNSYTYNNNLPQMVADVASSIPGHPVGLEVRSVMRPGTGLPDLWEEGDAVAALRARHWDYVVLQDYSLAAMTPESRELSEKATQKFALEITRAGAVPLLIETWVREPGSSWYSDPKLGYLKDATYMHAQLYFHTQALARKIGAKMIPVGEVWMKALNDHPELALYDSDGTHPSRQGTYLAALTIYQTLTGRTIEDASYSPTFTRPSNARAIRAEVSAVGSVPTQDQSAQAH